MVNDIKNAQLKGKSAAKFGANRVQVKCFVPHAHAEVPSISAWPPPSSDFVDQPLSFMGVVKNFLGSTWSRTLCRNWAQRLISDLLTFISECMLTDVTSMNLINVNPLVFFH